MLPFESILNSVLFPSQRLKNKVEEIRQKTWKNSKITNPPPTKTTDLWGTLQKLHVEDFRLDFVVLLVVGQ